MLEIAQPYTALTALVHLVVIGTLAGMAYRRLTGWLRLLPGLILFAWFGVTLLLSTQGAFSDMTQVVSLLGVVMTVPIIVGLGLMLYWQPIRKVIEALPLHWLMAVQVYRVLGVIFLVGWLNDELPTALGPTTALYDIAIGLTAPLVAWQYAQHQRVQLARLWNVLGILDFVYAVTIGVLAAPHALQLLQLSPDSSALGLLPLSLIAVWAVPLSILLHSACLMKLAMVDVTAAPLKTAPST